MFKFLYPINFKFIMENNYFNFRPKSLPDALSLRRWFCLILLSVSFILSGESVFAQKVPTPCGSEIPATVFGEDATEKDVANAKIRISGLPASDYRVVMWTGTMPAGVSFETSKKWSELTNGYLADNLATPDAAPGREYTIRIYKSDTTCYYDKPFVLPYVNFNFKPKYVDISVAVTKLPAGDVPLDSDVTVTIAVQNLGEIGATGVEFNVAAGLGLLPTGTPTASAGTYNPATGVWTIGNVAAGASNAVSLVITYKVTARGIREVKAWNTKLNETDPNSSPTQNTVLEDDQGQVCISTPYDYCKGDEYEYVLTGTPKNVQWSKNGSPISGNTSDFEVSADGKTLKIRSLGNYTYTAQYSESCPATGCCPITIEAGLPPVLTDPAKQVVCFGTPFDPVAAVNNQNGPFKSDQGTFTYQWYNNNGTNNANTDPIASQTGINLAAAALPTAPGVYSYRIISVQTGHTNCADTADVSLIINELPTIVASINSPVCAEDTILLDVTATAASGATAPSFTFAWTGPSYTSDQKSPIIPKADSSMAGQYKVTVSYTANGETCLATDEKTLVVNKLPLAPTVSNITYCAQDKGEKLSANGTGVKILWYGPMGSTPPVYGKTTPSDTTAVGNNVGPVPYLGAVGTDYYHVAQIDANGCISHTAPLAIETLTKPVKPVVEDLAYCQGSSSAPLTADLTAPTGYQLHWYTGTDTTGTSTVGNTYIAPPTGTVATLTYYVSQKTTGAVKDCESNMAKIDVIVKATPNAPGVTIPAPYCVDAVATPLVATADAGNTLTWYWNGGTQATAPTPTTTQSGGTWAYVSQSIVYTNVVPNKPTMTCESGQAAIPILVNPLPVATMIPISAICIGSEAQNNAQLVLTRYRDSDEVSWVLGSTYASGTPTAFASPAAGGVFASSLANPKPAGAQQDYTVRIKNTLGCTIDRTLPLVAKDCTCPGGYCEPATITKTK
jgi:hypothetical protein